MSASATATSSSSTRRPGSSRGRSRSPSVTRARGGSSSSATASTTSSPAKPVAVAGIHSCGRCEFCLRGQDNYCPRGASGRGYGEDGGLAQYLVVPRRELVPLRTLDPRRVGPLTDAGATSYHAVKRALPKLVPGSTAVVIGAGGLGSYAVQFLRRLTRRARDRGRRRAAAPRPRPRARRPRRARCPTATTALQVRELTGGKGATAVFDFVGDDTTMAMALASRGQPRARSAIVGAGGGHGQGVVGCAATRVRPVHPDGGVDRRPARGDRARRGRRAAGRGRAVRVRGRARSRTTGSATTTSRAAPWSRPTGRPATNRLTSH